MTTKTRENERRDSGIIIILILLLGFICIILASGWALRFAPNWKLDTNMGSNLDPNSDFLTSRPVGFIEPVDPAILTNPAWMSIFLTPGAVLETRTPQSTGTATATLVPVKTNTPIPSAAVSPTRTLVVTVVIPTITRTSAPPPPSTITPLPPSPTNTTIPPLPSADLRITKTDGVTTYTPGGPITYTIVVSNLGPSNATGARVADAIPASITGTTINCVASGSASCGTNASVGNNLSYTGVSISAGAGNSLTITVSGTVSPVTTGNLVNTATVTVGAGQSDPTLANNSATDTDTPIFIVDLGITKTDGVVTYTPGSTLTYTITVINNGPNAVTGAVVTDNFSSTQLTTWNWACTSQTGGATGCTAVIGSSADYADAVNLPVAASIVYTVTANISGTATGSLTNIANVAVPVGYTDPTSGNNSATDTDTQTIPPIADLQITKTDNATDYAGGITVQYIIVVSNPVGPSGVTGATVMDTFSTSAKFNPASINWTCAGSGGSSCTAAGIGDITDSFVNLPVGTSVTYTANATVVASPSGPLLVNTATVSVPLGITDPDTTNNSASDTDQLVTASSFPYFDINGNDIGTAPNGSAANILSGSFLTLQFGSPLVVGSHPSYDLVYYPDPSFQMDMVILQVSDGSNWYTIFYWGNGSPDGNTDINPADCPSETDNCVITPPPTNPPGISINLDGVIPNGTYNYIRIISLPDSGDGVDVDAIAILP